MDQTTLDPGRNAIGPENPRLLESAYFLATKIEAFLDRGNGDFLASHDLEDLIFVVDGRFSIVDEVRAESPPLRDYLQIHINELLSTPLFIDALPGYLFPDSASQARIGTILHRLKAIASPSD